MVDEDRRIGPHEVRNYIFADMAVDVHQLQASTTLSNFNNRITSLHHLKDE